MNRKIVLMTLVFAISFVSGCVEQSIGIEDSTSYSKAEMKLGYDGQDYFSKYNNGFVETETGYYYFDYSNVYAKDFSSVIYLMCFDKETKKSVPVCNRADCMHEKSDTDCNAQFSIESTENVTTTLPYFLWYYDGNLYTVIGNIDKESNSCSVDLYQVSLDGSKWTKYLEMYNLFEDKEIDIPYAFYHRGYIYYTITENDGVDSMYRIRLDKKAEPEVIDKLDDEYSYIIDYGIYDTGIVYIESQFVDDTYVDMINYYDTITGKITTLISDISWASYAVAEDVIYYSTNNILYACNIDTKDTKEIYEFDNEVTLSYDGEYLYAEVRVSLLDNYSNHDIYVLDLDGNLLDTINAPSSQDCYFGNSDYLFQMFDMNEDLTDKSDVPMIKVFDKNQIGTGEYEWIELPLPDQIVEHK